MELRATSTTLDVVVFVVLVGAAVGALVGASPGTGPGPTRLPDETADVLATSTTAVSFERSGTIPSSAVLDADESVAVSVDRWAHGTYAELLAAAAVADPSLGARSLTGAGGEFRTAVREATLRALPADEADLQVLGVWRPYDRAGLEGRVVVGERPPADADVSVATATVTSGFPSVASRLPETVGSYRTVARAVSRGVVAGLFPVEQTRDALASEGPDRAIVAARYGHAGEALGTDVRGPVADGNVVSANRQLAAALTTWLATDLAEQFDSPEAAAEAVSLHRVRIVVRTWSA